MKKLLLISLAVLVLAVAAAPADATFPGKPGPIVYSKSSSSESGTTGGLYSHGPRVSQRPVQLTDAAGDSMPAFSADGRKIVFVRNPEPLLAGSSIFVMNADGSGAKRLTEGLAIDGNPTISPDGKTVVFDRYEQTSNRSHLWSVAVAGGRLSQLTDGSNDEADPVYTPNGKRIVYTSNADQDARSDHSDIWAMAPDGSNQKVLVDGVRNESEPDVSPSGRAVVFSSNRNHGPNLFIANANGKRVRAVTHSKGDCFRGRCYLTPVFSPDGKHLLTTDGGRYSESLSVLTLDGSQQKTFDSGSTEEEGFGTHIGSPAWGPVPR
jgi:Tol biopolymer transport system component